MRVLIVEPTEADRLAHRSVVDAIDEAETREATDAVEAVAAAGEFSPDLAIIEGELPDMDGLELVRTLRASAPGLAVIIVSSDSARPRVIEAIKAGVDNYLVKPFTPDLLNQRIGETLERRRAA